MSTPHILIELIIRHGVNNWKLYSRLYDLSKLTNKIAHELFDYKKKQMTIEIKTKIEKYSLLKGKHEGLYEKLYSNGKLWQKYMYENDLYNGLFESWFKTGELQIRCTFKNMKKHGLYEEFHQNGNLEINCTYINNKLDGLCEDWTNDGRLIRQRIYKKGELINRIK